MDYTLHLTDECNFKCKYCYEEHNQSELSFEDIKSILNIAVKDEAKRASITFYGGEPLLRRDLIYKTIEYANKLGEENNFEFRYKMNTNGALLDDEFLKCIQENHIRVSYSIDGTKENHNLNRVSKNGKETYDIVCANAKKLLSVQPDANGAMVITTNNIEKAAESVKKLFEIGFKNVACAIDYTADWKDEDLIKLEKEYKKMAKLYYDMTVNEVDFNLLPFDTKIREHICKINECEELCILGKKHLNVGTDGNLYPCMQFVGNEKYILGNCKTGIDKQKQANLRQGSGKECEICSKCTIRTRCRHTCACANFLTSGDINMPSPLICETERMAVKIADELAEKLYKENVTMFLQKGYNKAYQLINNIEKSRSN